MTDLSGVPLTELFGEMFKRGKITGMVYIFQDEVYNWSKWDAEKTTQLDSDRVNGGCHILIVRDEPPTNKNWLQYYPVDMLVAELVKREGVESHGISDSYNASIIHEIECLDPVEVFGPATILVVRGERE